jgi:hypothetical protein
MSGSLSKFDADLAEAVTCAVCMAASVPVGAVEFDPARFAVMCAEIERVEALVKFRQELALRDALTAEAQRAIQARLTALYVQIQARAGR